jgi:hypothetical protein
MKKRGLDERRSDAASPQADGVDRRQLLARIIGGSVAAAGGLVLAADAHAEDPRKVFEVAALGHTFTFTLAPGATDPSNWRGTTFFVEGDLYRRGTIPVGVENWDPSWATPIGHWLARGWFINRVGRVGEEDRPAPPSVVHNEFLIGRIRPDSLFPPDQLTSSGLGGSSGPGGRPLHSVVGGTGRYLGAKGAVTFHTIGTNITGAPNFVCDFRLLSDSH